MVQAIQALGFYLQSRDREEGQGLVEYGLIIALIAVVCIVALEAIGGGVSGTLDTISAELGGAGD